MNIIRVWEMPNSKTFEINAISELIKKYVFPTAIILDPFANDGKIKERLQYEKYITNDLNPEMPTDYHLDATDFLASFPSCYADIILYDPPYSPRQVKECYEGFGKALFQEDTQMQFWSKQKDEIARVLKVGGVVLSFGWNTNGIGLARGFNIEEILLVAHGGAKNDTICTVERKSIHYEKLF